jgi:CBS domain-containing protein
MIGISNPHAHHRLRVLRTHGEHPLQRKRHMPYIAVASDVPQPIGHSLCDALGRLVGQRCTQVLLSEQYRGTSAQGLCRWLPLCHVVTPMGDSPMLQRGKEGWPYVAVGAVLAAIDQDKQRPVVVLHYISPILLPPVKMRRCFSIANARAIILDFDPDGKGLLWPSMPIFWSGSPPPDPSGSWKSKWTSFWQTLPVCGTIPVTAGIAILGDRLSVSPVLWGKAMSDKTVGELMHKGIIACRPQTRMTEVVRIVSDTDVHAIVVMDDEDHPLGIISHMDIIRFFGEDLSQYTAREVMKGGVIDIEADRPAKAAAALMLGKSIHRLIVVEVEGDERKPVGVLSTTDLVKDMRGARWIWYMG